MKKYHKDSEFSLILIWFLHVNQRFLSKYTCLGHLKFFKESWGLKCYYFSLASLFDIIGRVASLMFCFMFFCLFLGVFYVLPYFCLFLRVYYVFWSIQISWQNFPKNVDFSAKKQEFFRFYWSIFVFFLWRKIKL